MQLCPLYSPSTSSIAFLRYRYFKAFFLTNSFLYCILCSNFKRKYVRTVTLNPDALMTFFVTSIVPLQLVTFPGIWLLLWRSIFPFFYHEREDNALSSEPRKGGKRSWRGEGEIPLSHSISPGDLALSLLCMISQISLFISDCTLFRSNSMDRTCYAVEHEQ